MGAFPSLPDPPVALLPGVFSDTLTLEGGLMLSLLDPDRLRVGLAALAGAFVYGVYTLVTLFLSGAPVTRQDLIRAGLNVVAATLCGVVTAVVIAPAVAALIPWVSLRDLPAIGFLIGALTWEVLPFAIKAAKNRARREADKQRGA